MSSRPWKTPAYDRMVAAMRRQRLQPCWLCRQPIDYSVDYPHPDSFSADHVHPVSTHPHEATLRSNLAPAHLSCNIQRYNKEPTPPLGDTDWW